MILWVVSGIAYLSELEWGFGHLAEQFIEWRGTMSNPESLGTRGVQMCCDSPPTNQMCRDNLTPPPARSLRSPSPVAARISLSSPSGRDALQR